MHDDSLVVGAMKFNAVQIVKFDGGGRGECGFLGQMAFEGISTSPKRPPCLFKLVKVNGQRPLLGFLLPPWRLLASFHLSQLPLSFVNYYRLVPYKPRTEVQSSYLSVAK